MADPVIDPNAPPVPAPAPTNAQLIETQRAQDINNPKNFTIGDAVPSLDALMDQKRKDAEAAAAAAPVVDPAAPVVDPAAPATPVVPVAPVVPASDATPVAPASPITPVVPAATGPSEAELKTKADDIFKDVPALPPQASPAAGESFKALKVKAARDIYDLESKLTAAQKELEEAKTKLQSPIPQEVESELKELREFRAKLDVDFDPQFKKFDATIGSSRDFIYAQLAKSPNIPAETIQKIKDMGGPDKVKMEAILDAVGDGTIRRLVEAKLSDIEMESFRKDEAIKEAKKNISEYSEARQKEVAEQATAHLTRTKSELQGLVAKIPWLNTVPVDAKADANTKAAAEKHNAFAKHMLGELEVALAEDSPEMRATLLVGMANLFRLQSVHDQTKAHVANVEKELATAQETIKRLQASSASRLNVSGAPASGTAPVAPVVNPFTTTASDALDNLRRQKIEAGRS
jgi:hypothetical protein